MKIVSLFFICSILFLIAGCSEKNQKLSLELKNPEISDEWKTYGKNTQRTSSLKVPYLPEKMEIEWIFNTGEHSYQHQKGYSIWSSSVPVFKLNNIWHSVIGSYNKSLYCINLETGQIRWEKILLAPALRGIEFHNVNNVPCIFFVSEARIFSMISALDGKELFQYEIEPWEPESNPSFSGPGVWENGNFCFTVFTSNRKSLQFHQKTEYFEFNPISRKMIKRLTLTPQKLNGLTSFPLKNEYLKSFTSHLGKVSIFNSPEEILWTKILSAPSYDVSILSEINNQLYLFCCDHFGSVFSFNLHTGNKEFQFKAGYMLPSKASVFFNENKGILAVGSVDRNLYLLRLPNGEKIASIPSENAIQSSPTLIYTNLGSRCLFSTISGKIFLLNAENGQMLYSTQSEKALWPFETRAETLYSETPVWIQEKKIRCLFPAPDGKIYCLKLL